MHEIPTPTKEDPKTSEVTFSKGMIENRDKNIQLPDDNEELFRNFDKYVPKDFRPYLLATTPPRMMNREAIKKLLERDLYGATMEEVEKYFEDKMSKAEKDMSKKNSSDEEIRKYDEAIDLSNSLSFGSLEHPLGKLELEMWERAGMDDEESKKLRTYATRLNAEINKGRPKAEINKNDIASFIDETKKGYEKAKENGDAYNCEYILEQLKKGNSQPALEEVEKHIGHIQNLIAETRTQKDPGLRDIAKNSLTELYGNAYVAKLGQLRNYREFLSGTLKEKNESELAGEKRDEKTEQKKYSDAEKEIELEGEELFKQQIENNAYEEATPLKEDLILYLDSMDKGTMKSLPDLQAELDEVLYRRGIEYSSGNVNFKNDEEKRVLEPLFKLRQGLDGWNTFSSAKVESFRHKIMKYLEDFFGLEEYNPREGEKFSGKEHKAMSVEKTKNEFLNNLIKRVIRPGYRMNESMWKYYQEYMQNTRMKNQQEIARIKGTVSQEEFDKRYEEFQQWDNLHRFGKMARPAEVEIFKHE